MTLVDGKRMIGQPEKCKRQLEGRFSACHIVRPSEKYWMPLLPGRDRRDLEVIGTDEKPEAMSVVFRLNIAKQAQCLNLEGKKRPR